MRLSRRLVLRNLGLLGASALVGPLCAACQRGRSVATASPREVVKIVRETVVVASTPQIIEKTVEKVVTPSPAPRSQVTVMADVMSYGWSHFGQRMTPAFQELFPHITLQWRLHGGWDAYPQAVATLRAAGQLGDLIESPPGLPLARWAQDGTARALDEIIASEGLDVAGFFQGPWMACRLGERQMGVPFLAHGGANVLVYRNDLLAERGLAAPDDGWLLDDLLHAASALTPDADGLGDSGRYGLLLEPDLPSAYVWLHLFGGQLLSPDGRHGAIGEPGALATLQWLADVVRERHAAPPPHAVARGCAAMLLDGRAAFWRTDLLTAWNLVRHASTGRDLALAPLPPLTVDGRRGSLASGMAYCLTGETGAPHEAFQWCKFMSSRETGVQMFLAGYAEPGCRAASWQDRRVLEFIPIGERLAQMAESAQPARLPWNLNSAGCLAAWNGPVRAMLEGEMTAGEAASRIAVELSAALAVAPE